MTADESLAVVIPVYNGEGFLRRAVESVQRQSHSPSTILIADDCSTDGTMRLATLLREADSRIRIVRLPVNSGPSAARNVALRAVDEPLVAFLDADDQWLPHHLSCLAGAMSLMRSAAVAFDWVRLDGSTGESEDLTQATARLTTPLPRFFRENFVPQSAVLVRRELLLRAGGYREDLRYGEDYELWFRLALDGAQFIEVPLTGCLRTPHAGQVSFRNADRMYESAWRTRRNAVELLYPPPAGIPCETLDALTNALIEDVRGAWNSRRHDVLTAAVAVTSWVPGSEGLLAPWRSRLGSKWKLWRAMAMLWDALPDSVKRIKRTQLG